jgi:hypothetical protein
MHDDAWRHDDAKKEKNKQLSIRGIFRVVTGPINQKLTIGTHHKKRRKHKIVGHKRPWPKKKA